MNKIIGLLVVASVAMLLVACKSSLKEAKVYTKRSEMIKVVDDQAQLKQLVGAWESKERTLEKLLPLFEYKVEMDVDGEAQVWLFNKAGYLMQEGDSALYKTEKTDIFADLVK